MSKIPDSIETLRKARFYLATIYKIKGPKAAGKTVPYAEYAAMKPKEIAYKWDFDARYLMHKIAKMLVEIDSLPTLRRAKIKQPK